MVLKVTGSNPVIHLNIIFTMVDKIFKYLIFFKQFQFKYYNFFQNLIKVFLTFTICFFINVFICYKYIFVVLDFFIKLIGNDFIITYDSFTISSFIFWFAVLLTFSFFLVFGFFGVSFYLISLIYKENFLIYYTSISIYYFFACIFNYLFFTKFLQRRFIYNQGFQVNSFVSQNSIYLDNNLYDCCIFIIESFLLFNFILVLPVCLIFLKNNYMYFFLNFLFNFRMELYVLYYFFNAFMLLSAKFTLFFLLFIVIVNESFYYYLLYIFLIEY